MSESLAGSLARAAEDLHSRTGVQSVYEAAVRSVVELVPDAAYVAITSLVKDALVTLASSDDEIARDGVTGLGPEATFPLETRGREATTLIVHAACGQVLDDRGVEATALIARHTHLAMVHVRRHENLLAALENRTAIGIALGLVMERMKVDQDAAFAYLTRLSETSERKLRDVAATVVADHLAALPARPAPGSD